MNRPILVIPAKAGTQFEVGEKMADRIGIEIQTGSPACAGMTTLSELL